MRRSGGGLVLDIAKERLYNAPSYSKLRDITLDDEVTRIRAYFGDGRRAACSGEEEASNNHS
jgi:hypothetical protein